MPKPKTTQRPYRDIIIERINRDSQNQSYSNTHKKSQIQTLKTQCTPNERQQTEQLQQLDAYQLFKSFNTNFEIKYMPIKMSHRKPLNRCLYYELIELSQKQKKSRQKKQHKRENQSLRLKQNSAKNLTKQTKNRCNTQQVMDPYCSFKFQIQNKKINSFKNGVQNSQNANKKPKYKMVKGIYSSNKKLEKLYLSRQKSLTSLRNQTKQKEKNLRKSMSKGNLFEKKHYQVYSNCYKSNVNYNHILGRNSKKQIQNYNPNYFK